MEHKDYVQKEEQIDWWAVGLGVLAVWAGIDALNQHNERADRCLDLLDRRFNDQRIQTDSFLKSLDRISKW